MKFRAWLRALGLNLIQNKSKLRAQSLKVEARAFRAFEQLVHLWLLLVCIPKQFLKLTRSDFWKVAIRTLICLLIKATIKMWFLVIFSPFVYQSLLRLRIVSSHNIILYALLVLYIIEYDNKWKKLGHKYSNIQNVETKKN